MSLTSPSSLRAVRDVGGSACTTGGTPLPANDDDRPEPGDAALLRAALRLFDTNGADAADVAQERAGQAFFAADRSGTRWWLAVGRTLDRMAAAGHGSQASQAPGTLPPSRGGHRLAR
jgi:hypothetical protein